MTHRASFTSHCRKGGPSLETLLHQSKRPKVNSGEILSTMDIVLTTPLCTGYESAAAYINPKGQ